MDCSLSDDLSDIMKVYLALKKAYDEEEKEHKVYKVLSKTLNEESRVIREIEKDERNNLMTISKQMTQQQDTTNKLLGVKAENNKLLDKIQELEGNIVVLKDVIAAQKQKWCNERKHLQQKQEEEIKELNSSSVQQVGEARKDLEEAHLEFRSQYQELKSELEANQNDRQTELNVTVLNYEEQMQLLREELGAVGAELHQMMEWSGANSIAYQKRVCELEQENRLLQERCKFTNPQTTSPPKRRSFQYPAARPSSILRRVTSCDEPLMADPSDFLTPASKKQYEPRKINTNLHAPSKNQHDTSRNQLYKGFTPASSIVKPKLQFVTGDRQEDKNCTGRNLQDVRGQTGKSFTGEQSTAIVAAATIPSTKRRKLFSQNDRLEEVPEWGESVSLCSDKDRL